MIKLHYIFNEDRFLEFLSKKNINRKLENIKKVIFKVLKIYVN